MISGLRDRWIIASPPSKIFDGGRGDRRSWPQCIDRDFAAQLTCKSQHNQAHTEFCHRVGGVRREPLLGHLEGRGEHQDMRVFAPCKIGNGKFRNHERAAGVDLLHEIVTPHIGCRDRRQLDRAGVVYDNIDASEFLRRLIERGLHGCVVAYVDRQG